MLISILPVRKFFVKDEVKLCEVGMCQFEEVNLKHIHVSLVARCKRCPTIVGVNMF